MRPILLRMSAFGPFADVEEINFNDLGDNPLFLINGPTGSGKSTILDAICFALYGETTGNERDAKQMRCDQADPATMTEVTLEFQLASGRYRITRIPDQERPKARGEGVTEQKARAELYKLDGEDESLIVAPKITEATNEIVNLTGLSAEQFRQVMVLPQGQFRELLLAKSEEREAIFQQLFQTHVYSTLQAKLREQANALTNQIKEIQTQQSALLEAHELETSEQLQTELDILEETIINLDQQKQQVEAKLKQVQATLHQAQLLEKAFAEQAQAQAKITELKTKQAEIDDQKVKLDSAKKAREIEPLYSDTQKQKTALDKVIKQVKDCQQTLTNFEKSLLALESEKQKIPSKEKSLEKLSASIIELENYRQRSLQLKTVQLNLTVADKELSESEKALGDKNNQLLEAKKTLEQVEASLHAQTKATAELPEKKVKLEKLEEQGKSMKKITDLQSGSEKVNATITTLRKDMQQADKSYQQKVRDKEIYEQAWHKGQAAILANDLDDSKPCPVCGSKDHPDIASSSENLPTEQELNRIRQGADESQKRLEKITQDVLLKEEESKHLLKNLKEEKSKDEIDVELSLEAIREQYQQCKKEIDDLQKIMMTLPEIQQQIERTKNSIKTLERELSEAQKITTKKVSTQAAAKTEVKNIQAELPVQYQQVDALEEAVVKTTKERDQLKLNIADINQGHQQAREAMVAANTALKSTQVNQQSIDTLFNQANNRWQKGLKQSAFENETAFTETRIDKEAEQQLTNNIRQYEDEKLLAQKQLEEKTAAIAKKIRPDLNQLIESESQAVSAKNTFDAEYHKTQQRYDSLKKTKAKLKKSLEQQTRLESEYGVIGKLNDVSNGKNPHNLNLQRFVLSVLLDDVLIDASNRLLKMSKGRYQLYRKETVGDKRSKSGLELEVEDTYTGYRRSAETLSGGESFLAALALALGLSDVVQSHSGGIRLDTLFIDEGFGSLDPESLELAINTLLDLRASGRMIGIISHVEELKRIIDIRLDVFSDRGVSTTKLVVA